MLDPVSRCAGVFGFRARSQQRGILVSGASGRSNGRKSTREADLEGINRILVVSRDTAYCKEAVHAGISLARTYGAELAIIHVIHNPFGLEGWNLPTVALDKEYQNIIANAKADLDKIVAREKADGLPIKELIREGEPTAEVLKAVKEEKSDLLIMLAHEEGRLEHFLFGRSNDELVRRMPCSILLVKKEPRAVRW